MIINLLKTDSEMNRLVKKYSAVKSVSGNLTDACSIINPDFTLEYDAAIYNANYCYIPEFKRYYFITEIIVEEKFMMIKMHADALMNAHDAVMKARATILRSNLEMPDIEDPMVITTTAHQIQYKEMGSLPIKEDGWYIINIGGRDS